MSDMPEPIERLEESIVWSEADIAKCELLWGMNDFDRGIQNMGMEINKLRTALTAAQRHAERMKEALELAIRQNSHDMVMTGDEIRLCEAALNAEKP